MFHKIVWCIQSQLKTTGRPLNGSWALAAWKTLPNVAKGTRDPSFECFWQRKLNCQDNTALSIFLDVLVKLTNTVFVNSTNIYICKYWESSAVYNCLNKLTLSCAQTFTNCVVVVLWKAVAKLSVVINLSSMLSSTPTSTSATASTTIELASFIFGQ